MCRIRRFEEGEMDEKVKGVPGFEKMRWNLRSIVRAYHLCSHHLKKVAV